MSGDTATGRGSLIAEIWTGDKARRLMDTPDRAALDDLPAPDRTKSAPLFEFPNTTEQGIFVRLRGYVHPPEDGKYRFWIAGDDECKLFLSENEDAKKARRIAQVGGWTEVRAWNTEGSQKS
ncbi:MAG: PA14 domain-containing protein [Verrucomicrobiales bacterium]